MLANDKSRKKQGGSGSHTASEYGMSLSPLWQRVPGEGALAKAQSGNTCGRTQEARGAGDTPVKVKGERSQARKLVLCRSSAVLEAASKILAFNLTAMGEQERGSRGLRQPGVHLEELRLAAGWTGPKLGTRRGRSPGGLGRSGNGVDSDEGC